MQLANYFFASVISFSGLAAGFLLVKIAPEEQKPLAKKISLSREIFLYLTFAFTAFYYYSSIFYLLVIAASLALLLFAKYKTKSIFRKSTLAYAVFGILFFISSKNTSLFAIASSLIFLHGMPAASLMYNPRQKNLAKIFLSNSVFLVIANALFLIG